MAVYRDAGISGAKGRDKRPGFDAMHKDVARRRFDVVMAWSVDRLGRSSARPLRLPMRAARRHRLFLHQQGIDTTTPAGKAMFQMMGVFAEFERAMIRERVNAGIARAKADGTPGRSRRECMEIYASTRNRNLLCTFFGRQGGPLPVKWHSFSALLRQGSSLVKR